MSGSGKRLMIFDRTCRGRTALPGLSHAWSVGGRLYAGLSRIDAFRGISSWEDGLRWLVTQAGDDGIAEVQFWGHGKWGEARVGAQVLNRAALDGGHSLRAELEAVRERFHEDGLFWFRTCETFGARRGHDFARAWTDFFGGRAAGHTHVIGTWQSGLHGLRAGHRPTWALGEGLAAGTADAPRRALGSRPYRPHTITCFDGSVPPLWFA